jgi:hypothetical protein
MAHFLKKPCYNYIPNYISEDESSLLCVDSLYHCEEHAPQYECWVYSVEFEKQLGVGTPKICPYVPLFAVSVEPDSVRTVEKDCSISFHIRMHICTYAHTYIHDLRHVL